MEYLILCVGLLFLELAYFKLADRFNIIDKPNQRSSHTEVTIRGGGVVFVMATLAWFLTHDFQYPYAILGLLLISGISFLDDIYELSSKLRLGIQFTAVILLLYQTGIFDAYGTIWSVLALIVVVGFTNAVNFMDGINGITGLYALAGMLSLWYINETIGFTQGDLLLYNVVGVLVFLFFNLRKKAKCFAGDVGSVSIAFLLSFWIVSLLLKTGNVAYLGLVAVYGVDAVLTIIHRLLKKENIFEAHRSHLYQYLANEMQFSHIGVSISYFLVQLLLNICLIYILSHYSINRWLLLITMLVLLVGVYIGLKTIILKKSRNS